MRTVTSVKPLMVNFMEPYEAPVISEEKMKIIYDPSTQTTIVMGGKSGPTRSNDGYKSTTSRLPGGNGYHTENDAERYTDD